MGFPRAVSSIVAMSLLLLASEDGRLGRVVGMDPVRAQLPQLLEVVAHGSLPIGGRSSRKLNRARLRRERTVPIGTASTLATSS